MRFFWKGSDVPAHGARVNWKQVCFLRSEGGLGLKSLECWSKTCLFYLIRNILADEGSLWVAWLKTYVFKNDGFWTIPCKPHFSWVVKKLLKMRGDATSLFSGVSSFVNVNAAWIWEKIRDRSVKVEWQKLVWFSSHVPKHSIIAWMAILNRLPTKDRLLKMGIALNDVKCVLCLDALETRSHIFFDCPFAAGVWEALLQICKLDRGVMHWDEELSWAVAKLKEKSLIFHILKLAWNAFIYIVWEERNFRLYRGTSRTVRDLVGSINTLLVLKCKRNV
ncbi:hypothetical protein GQ457_07G024120 [Hibiscus cannabinus]